MKLTEKQKRFIDFYIETGNATEAAKKAGYKGKNLNRIGSENLSKLDKYIQVKLQGKEKSRIASQDEVLEAITAILRKKEASDKDKLKAAELLGKLYGSFSDKVELTGKDGGEIKIKWME